MQNSRFAKQRFGRNRFSKPFRRKSGGFNKRNRRRPGENIDISRFIKKPTNNIYEKKIEIKHKFSDFGLHSIIENNLRNKNYITPTPIQDKSIEPIMQGKDVVGLANTGTGKTAAFLLPLIHKVNNNRSQKVLIIAPTRELAMQIETEFRQFSDTMKIYSALCVGGLPIYKQISNLRRNPNFIIGTPGRLNDLCKRRAFRFEQFNNVVIDEIDRMLDMGFINEIKDFLNQMPKQKQSLFFSATIPVKIKELINQFLINPVIIETSTGSTTNNVEQDIVRVINKESKFNQLQDLLNKPELSKVLIFSETKAEVEKLARALNSFGFKAESIHGDKRQSQRQRALKQFKDNQINILVATDVAARGLDIKNVTHVINYTIPQTYNDYIHRIGRTGRGDCKGIALTFIDSR